ncbi:hypothetical protein Hamer_G012844 [Homarus americanus]|uniref:Uncharacterized protein n=1 Tax=Homarus americanus TaxID=6706 RepID=A0A8J5K5F4_HOMAM|nr:hypothetical protein Hamer_G012844 [Homarus americanus]
MLPLLSWTSRRPTVLWLLRLVMRSNRTSRRPPRRSNRLPYWSNILP